MLNLTATAVGYSLDISQVVNIGPKWWLLITLLLGIGLLGWVIVELNGQLNEKPSITVRPIKERDSYYLLVTNKGAFASFTAQIKLTSNDPSVLNLSTLSHYQGLWVSPDKIKADIYKGQSARIRIADITPDDMGFDMEIYYYQNLNIDGKVRTNPYWVGTITNGDTGVTRPLEHPESHHLLVTISATPGLREGFYRQKFRLDYKGLLPESKS